MTSLLAIRCNLDEWPQPRRKQAIRKKFCPRCRVVKPADQFSKMSDGRLSFYCKKCKEESND